MENGRDGCSGPYPASRGGRVGGQQGIDIAVFALGQVLKEQADGMQG
ncbi:MAG: hypothetical protein ETSY1_16545 [Candidatus Entotheonella factor]|uniref:Uncharacterized protein n=1 Tax=Entotheonella factor TaxID=1429438 RepID=W4LLN9_ENTF1|nr:MAG: hypothetical protein ETSY1_16545 [Candidatus Entotheonella factor]